MVAYTGLAIMIVHLSSTPSSRTNTNNHLACNKLSKGSPGHLAEMMIKQLGFESLHAKGEASIYTLLGAMPL